MSPADRYLAITAAVETIIRGQGGNDTPPTARLIARAALLQIRGVKGDKAAAEAGYSLGDEMVALEGLDG